MAAAPRLYRSVDTPVGRFTIAEAEGAVVAAGWRGPGGDARSPLLDAAAGQLAAYFDRRLQDFDLPLMPAGTAFERAVWQGMCAIPYGQTRTYADLAKVAGGVARAVGQACGSNPIPIFIPCHRITGSHGLGGFSGGEGRMTKRRLLGLEGAMLDI
ncbi:methylated-DNA-[protein]-cysteine S-methyltransferase [Stella humosa]|uniref:Methylated-DNA--protein-cysteine methyltransferase n=1 Tax=Stella humosa TaxID=94 RepID=A0A3N1LD04_9PROT|nr:methylated-DNA--[protein]-cysteine S-methyltransferase [Stella humosa]ROP90951.1 methylated-DNA-[protein]-cysteine S-methyltransferase [Stella humosa]BBK34699.1 methylated-DNA--protein-cysteine methyltransferase [Stella humosa]